MRMQRQAASVHGIPFMGKSEIASKEEAPHEHYISPAIKRWRDASLDITVHSRHSISESTAKARSFRKRHLSTLSHWI
jgi:hypothetical protein